MNRFISCLLFITIFVSVCFLPTMDKSLDRVMVMSQDVARAEETRAEEPEGEVPFEAAQTEKPVLKATPIPTPEPTPAPTPIPTPTPPPILKGDAGDSVLRVQNELVTLGFMTTSPDGVFGNNTEKAVTAVKEYLNKIDRDENGTYLSDEALAEFLTPTEAPAEAEPTEDAEETEAPKATEEPGATEDPDATPTPRPTRPPKYGTSGSDIPYSLIEALEDHESFPAAATVERGTEGAEALRVQRRLNTLKYIFQGVDGKVGNTTVDAISNFQRLHGLPQTGIADKATLQKLFSASAIENDQPLHPYKLYVSRKEQRVYIYQWNDSTEQYDIRYKSFICSTGKKGSETPAGTFYQDTGPAARWHYFKEFNCWAQYAYSIQGNILFHSVLFSKQDEKTLTKSSLRNLGKAASHGCVRLKVEDAKWIWDNCPHGTTVVIE